MSDYADPIDLVVGLLRSAYRGGPFKAIYDGDPDVIPKSSLPALCVLQPRDANEPAGSLIDYVTTTIQVRIVYDKRDDWTVTSDKSALTDKKIRRIVGERGADGKYLQSTIKGVLTRNLSLSSDATIQQEMTFELDTTLRPQNMVTREGTLTIKVLQVVSLV